MSNTLTPDRPLSTITEGLTAGPAAQYLGPALVTGAAGQEVTLELPTGKTVTAKLALAYLYEPAPGDVLLSIGNAEAHYAIGVLHSNGRAVLAFRGDVDLRAVDGAVRISGDRGVSIDGPEIEMHASKLRMVAGTVVQRFDSLYKRVTSLLHVHAGKSHTAVDGLATTQAESVTMLSKEVVTINGKQIQLG